MFLIELFPIVGFINLSRNRSKFDKLKAFITISVWKVIKVIIKKFFNLCLIATFVSEKNNKTDGNLKKIIITHQRLIRLFEKKLSLFTKNLQQTFEMMKEALSYLQFKPVAV